MLYLNGTEQNTTSRMSGSEGLGLKQCVGMERIERVYGGMRGKERGGWGGMWWEEGVVKGFWVGGGRGRWVSMVSKDRGIAVGLICCLCGNGGERGGILPTCG